MEQQEKNVAVKTSRLGELRAEVRRRDIEDETQRRMINWVRWKTGAPIGLAVSSAYALEAPGRREETSIPLLNGEAMDVDVAVEVLPLELKLAIDEYWLRKGTIRQKLHRCRCGAKVFYLRLDQAHGRIRQHLQVLKNRGRRLAALHARAAPIDSNGGISTKGGLTPLRQENKPV